MKLQYDRLAGTRLEGYINIYIYIYIFHCDYRSPSASITHGEFDLFVGPRATTYYYKSMYTYCVYGTFSMS